MFALVMLPMKEGEKKQQVRGMYFRTLPRVGEKIVHEEQILKAVCIYHYSAEKATDLPKPPCIETIRAAEEEDVQTDKSTQQGGTGE